MEMVVKGALFALDCLCADMIRTFFFGWFGKEERTGKNSLTAHTSATSVWITHSIEWTSKYDVQHDLRSIFFSFFFLLACLHRYFHCFVRFPFIANIQSNMVSRIRRCWVWMRFRNLFSKDTFRCMKMDCWQKCVCFRCLFYFPCSNSMEIECAHAFCVQLNRNWFYYLQIKFDLLISYCEFNGIVLQLFYGEDEGAEREMKLTMTPPPWWCSWARMCINWISNCKLPIELFIVVC